MPLSFPYTVRSAYQRLIAAGRSIPIALLVSLIAIIGIAWVLTLYQAVGMSGPSGAAMQDNSAAREMGGMAIDTMLSPARFGVFVMVWIVMMAGMMLPAAMPMILIFASAQARRKGQATIPTWIFIAGYLLVWGIAGLLVYGLTQTTPVNHRVLGGREVWAPFVLPATLIIAGTYQFTPLKDVCLRHCRSPNAFVAQHWRDGRVGALEMGVQHGLYCLGCCWALFAVLVAAGMMSITWMLLLTAIIFAEKVLPHGTQTSAVVGLGFNVLALLFAVNLQQP